MTDSGVVRVGVVGLGRVSESHLTGYEKAEGARVVAVCDLDEARAEAVAERFGARAFTDHRELVADPEVDAVAILLPHLLHFPVASEALKAGKHICVEKPFTVTEAEATTLIDLAREDGLIISVAENTRFVHAYLEMAKLLEKGALGEIRSIRAFIGGSAIPEYVDDTSPWKRERFGAGTIIDTAPHMIYLLKWLFDDTTYIRTIARNWYKGIEVDDHALLIGELMSGTMFSLEFCLVAEYPWSERLEVHGSEGSLIIDQLLDPPAVIYRGEEDLKGTPVESIPYNMANWKADSIAVCVEDFVDAVREGRPAGLDLEDARYTQRVIDAAFASVAADGAPVEVGPADERATAGEA